MPEARLRMTFRGRQADFELSDSTLTLRQLSKAVQREFQVDPAIQKLLVGGKLFLPVEALDLALSEAGIKAGDKVLVLTQPGKDELANLDVPDQRIRGFDEELIHASRRRQSHASTFLPSGNYTFRAYEAWNLPVLHPPPAEALKLLHRLAADRGIAALMTQHRWSVGKLSEMPPEGRVGVSPVCILGVNINQGQEISLRLRTDDLRGFRRYDRIRETLVHELAHMVFSEHDNNFKALNSQLLREAAAHDWTKSATALAGDDASFHEGFKTFSDGAQPSHPAIRRLGGILPITRDAQNAAAQAALERAHAQAASAPPVPELQAVGLSGSVDDQQESIEGLGHHDGTTEKLENEMRLLGTPTAKHGSSSPFTRDVVDDGAYHELGQPCSTGSGEKHYLSEEQGPFTRDHTYDDSFHEGAQPSINSNAEVPHHISAEQSSDAAHASASPVELAVHGVLSAAAPADAKAALDSVIKIIQHIVDQPGEAKYRRLRERPLERRLGGLLPHCVQLLQAFGFETIRIDGEAVLLLMENDSDRLQSVLQVVQHQHNILSR